jgi:uncharacterized membrane protein YtjA (UPF0391 family)
MSGWNVVYLIIAIIAGVLGLWNLARQRNTFLAITGILWFLVVLFEFVVRKDVIYDFQLFPGTGIPQVGILLTFVLVPVFLILAFFASNRR